ncbi:MAG: type II secretion system protein [Sulfurovaceae bacterium]|nr:type II secretion system protein [Sulfurovaceae bacterium]MDD5549196.1 type II secretion system protein [Sulfurovaceae bacterium]
MLKNKTAFTMIELVFVIVTMGIIAAVAIPRLQNDSRQEAIDQVLSDIRYAQHLALTDDVTNPANPNWQRAFWGIRFVNDGGQWIYSIGSDKNLGGNFDGNEYAIDSLSGLPMNGNNTAANPSVSPRTKLFKKGVTNVTFGGAGCAAAPQHIGFDRLGRPHQSYFGSTSPDYSSVLTNTCDITFTHPSGNFVIRINPETGYAFETSQPDM